MTIYVLTEGFYSNYRIVAVYSTKELAEEANSLCPDSQIEEYELDSLVIPEHPPGHSAWSVSINTKTDCIESAHQCDPLSRFFAVNEKYYGCPKYVSHLSPVYRVNCWARDEEHAKKIALDKYYQWKWEKSNDE